MPWPLDTSRAADQFDRLQAHLAQRYRLERELGRVGTATAYLARDLASDRPVALKVLDASRAAGGGPGRLVEELRSAARATHPRILPILDVGLIAADGGQSVYYAVPFPAGETLRARLDRELQLPVGDALTIAEDLAAALAAAHAQGVVHGAVAPESVVLAGGEALLDDLGVGRALDPNGPGAAADIRALGRLLYEMLSGAAPADGSAPPLRAGRAGIPEEVELTVAQLLAPEPRGYRSAADALAAIRKAAAAARAISLPGGTTGERRVFHRRVPARWSVFTVAVAGLLALSLWLRYQAPELSPPQPPPARPRSVAVLPFVNATADSGNLYLSHGITRELTAALGRLPGLRVAGQASAFRLSRGRMAARQVGERLGVDAILEGTVRPLEGRLRIRAHLLSVREGFDLWSETYEHEGTDLADLQREIVAAVAGVLRLPVDTGRVVAPVSPAAHEAYLRALQAGEAADSARIALLEESASLDSAFAPAWAALGLARLAGGPRDTLRPTELARLVRGAAERALALDSSLPEAHALLATVRFQYDWDWAGAEASFRRSIALNPNLPESHLGLAHLLLVTGRVDEALEAGRRALELSPFDPGVRLRLARQALHVGDYVRAQEELDQARRPGSGATELELLQGLVLAATGRYAEAVEPLTRAAADSTPSDEAVATLGWAQALGGWREEARAIRAILETAGESRYVSPYLLAFLADALGDRRTTFIALEQAFEVRAPELVDLRIDARMDRLRVDRRYDALARRIGLP